jgi:hypothetical protein
MRHRPVLHAVNDGVLVDTLVLQGAAVSVPLGVTDARFAQLKPNQRISRSIAIGASCETIRARCDATARSFSRRWRRPASVSCCGWRACRSPFLFRGMAVGLGVALAPAIQLDLPRHLYSLAQALLGAAIGGPARRRDPAGPRPPRGAGRVERMDRATA